MAEEISQASGDRPPVNYITTTRHGSFDDEEDEGLPDLVHEYIEKSMVLDDKQDYLEACRVAPQLVLQESPVERFLRCEQDNVAAAAHRLVGYWQLRRRLFGARAFYPMHLPSSSGSGKNNNDAAASAASNEDHPVALYDSDFQYLRTGFVSYLPPTHDGHPVTMYNSLRLEKEGCPLNIEAEVRCIFYVTQVASEHAITQTDGVLLISYNSRAENNRCAPRIKDNNLVYDYLPVKIKAMYMVPDTEDPTSRPFLENSIAFLHRVLGKAFQNTFVPLLGDTVSDYCQQLLLFGLDESGIPMSLGGTWDYKHFEEWLLERHELEYLQRRQRQPSQTLHVIPGSSTNKSASSAREDSKPAGTTATNVLETDEVIQRSLSQFFEVMQLLPYEEKAEYLEALEQAPDLIQNESVPLRLLRTEQFSPWKAAKRMARFWRYRKIIFQDRFLLPLNKLDGTGALMQTEVDDLKTGAMAHLYDSRGVPVVFYDRSRVGGTTDSRMRIFFYMICAASEHEQVQREGVSYFFLVSPAAIQRPLSHRNSKLGIEFHENGAPARMKEVSMLCILSESEASIQLAVPAMRKLVADNAKVASTPAATCRYLESQGFPATSLPESLGGTWSYQNFDRWLQKRIEVEGPVPMPKSIPAEPQLENDAASASSFGVDIAERLRKLDEALSLVPEEDKEAYSEAMKRAPFLFQNESDPRKFLAREKNDPWKAAKRMITYWKERKDCFGDRAFRSLDLTGTGALSHEDIEAFRIGLMIPLGMDEMGRCIIFHDWSKYKLLERFGKKCRLRGLYYVLNWLSQNSRSATDGWVLIVAANGRIGDECMRAALNVMESGAVFQCASHFIFGVETTTENELGNLMTQSSTAFGSGVTQACHHFVKDFSEAHDRLKSYGIPRSCLPSLLGGPSSDEDIFQQFVKQRQSVEKSRSSSVSSKASEEPGMKIDHNPEHETKFKLRAEEIEDRGLKELEDAICIIPDDEKSALLEARARAPSLASTESDVLLFLKYTSFDALVAAYRLCRYWSFRKEWFGERAFLPLNATGEGALSDSDIALLSTGWVTILPNDTSGRPVFLFDQSRLQSCEATLASKVRTLFYMLSAAAENNSAQADGGLWISLVRTMTKHDQDVQFFHSIFGMVNESTGSCLYRVKSLHIVIAGSRETTEQALTFMLPRFRLIMGEALSQRMVVHNASSSLGLLRDFELHGLSRSGLPTTMDGTWSYENYYNWQKVRIESERSIHQRLASVQSDYAVDNPESVSGKLDRGSSDGDFEISMIGMLEEKKGTKEERIQSLDEIKAEIMTNPSLDQRFFREAMAGAPDLVEKESDAIKFLQHENHNLGAASLRMCEYWRRRKALFGDLYWLRALNQTGEGALGREDLKLMASGRFLALPKDQTGRPVIFFNLVDHEASDNDSLLRLTFYLFSVLVENEKSQSDGAVCLFLIRDIPHEGVIKELFRIVGASIPVRTHSVHIILEPGQNKEALEKVGSSSLFFAGLEMRKKAKIVMCSSKAEIAQRLKASGLCKKGLPKVLGGDWSYEHFARWQDLRMRFEWDLPLGQSHRDLKPGDGHEVERFSNLTAEQQYERKRRLNVLHSRRKREKQRVDQEIVREKAAELEEEKFLLLLENQRLEKLMRQAVNLVTLHGGDVSGGPDIFGRLIAGANNESARNHSLALSGQGGLVLPGRSSAVASVSSRANPFVAPARPASIADVLRQTSRDSGRGYPLMDDASTSLSSAMRSRDVAIAGGALARNSLNGDPLALLRNHLPTAATDPRSRLDQAILTLSGGLGGDDARLQVLAGSGDLNRELLANSAREPGGGLATILRPQPQAPEPPSDLLHVLARAQAERAQRELDEARLALLLRSAGEGGTLGALSAGTNANLLSLLSSSGGGGSSAANLLASLASPASSLSNALPGLSNPLLAAAATRNTNPAQTLSDAELVEALVRRGLLPPGGLR